MVDFAAEASWSINSADDHPVQTAARPEIDFWTNAFDSQRRRAHDKPIRT
jgi:hypothetical protein